MQGKGKQFWRGCRGGLGMDSMDGMDSAQRGLDYGTGRSVFSGGLPLAVFLLCVSVALW
jgi:hypothetical protein